MYAIYSFRHMRVPSRVGNIRVLKEIALSNLLFPRRFVNYEFVQRILLPPMEGLSIYLILWNLAAFEV